MQTPVCSIFHPNMDLVPIISSMICTVSKSTMHQHNIHIFIFKFGKDIVKFIKDQRIRWLGHVKRMEVGAMPRKRMEGRLHKQKKRKTSFEMDG